MSITSLPCSGMFRERSNTMSRRRGMTFVEFLLVVSIVALLIGILLPALGAARRTARCIQNSTPVRGIHQGHVLFSQGNNGYFAGLNPLGELVSPFPAGADT